MEWNLYWIHWTHGILQINEAWIEIDLTCELMAVWQDNGVFSKWSGTFVEFSDFSEFRESEESLKHELGSI